ncbi:hypothetical protein [Bradyrhizobium lupini]|uniref:hypothetical protein n=1 Tax=Rhizobium lupini TaxID=136996 RepID=UPI0034C65DC3
MERKAPARSEPLRPIRRGHSVRQIIKATAVSIFFRALGSKPYAGARDPIEQAKPLSVEFKSNYANLPRFSWTLYLDNLGEILLDFIVGISSCTEALMLEKSAEKVKGSPEKRKKFVELAENRTRNAIKAIRVIAKLGNRSAYEYTEADVKKIAGALQREIDALKARMMQSGTKDSVDFSL